jgi:hypothetical protein
MINSPAHAIERLGGVKALRVSLKKHLTTVASWETRNSIPVAWWPKLISLAETQGLEGFTYEALALAHAKAKSPRRRKAA